MTDQDELTISRDQLENLYRQLLSAADAVERCLGREPRLSQLRKLYHTLNTTGDVEVVLPGDLT